MTKIIIVLPTLVFLMFSTATEADNSKSKCTAKIVVTRELAMRCEEMKSKDATIQCFNRIFVGNSKINLGRANQLSEAIYNDPKKINCVTFNERTFETPVSLSYRSKNAVSSAESQSLRVREQAFVFTTYFCGWEPDGSFHRKLITEYKFVPTTATITPISPKCIRPNELDVEGVVLNTETTICEMSFVANTSFGYAPDDQYHFTALNDGTMKNGDKLIPIKKGKDYRNSDPAEHPCKWEETPEEVLKSFTEEHSE